MEIESTNYDVNLHSIIANVTNEKRIKDVCKTFKVDTIYHSAAYKHVPLVEENPFEGVINNIFGTQTCAEAAIESGVETFVLISTDKAVRPTNIMGASKRFAEMILQSFSDNIEVKKKTRMTMVRFGNVLGSNIYNVLGVLGVSSFFGNFSIPRAVSYTHLTLPTKA